MFNLYKAILSLLTVGVLIVGISDVKMKNKIETIEKDLETIGSLSYQIDSINALLEVIVSDQYSLAEKLEVQLTRLQNVNVNLDDLTIKSNILVHEVEVLLQGTKLVHLSQAFVDAEQRYGVNAIFLMGLASLESGYGTSARAAENNYTGMGAYSPSAEGIKYDSGYENILDTARQLSENYLSEEGMYYKGKDIKSVASTYCIPSEHWYESISSISLKYVQMFKENFVY